MKTSEQVQRRAARAMKRAIQHGVDPRNTAQTQGRIFQRIWVDDVRRELAKAARKAQLQCDPYHVHKFDWDGTQQCECGAKFF